LEPLSAQLIRRAAKSAGRKRIKRMLPKSFQRLLLIVLAANCKDDALTREIQEFRLKFREG